jgi:type VI secretion system protein ImpC
MVDVNSISFLPKQGAIVPFKALVLAPLCGENAPEELNEPIEINHNNFDHVIKSFSPVIDVDIDNPQLCQLMGLERQTITLSYALDSYSDFEPAAIIQKEPSLLEISRVIDTIHKVLQQDGNSFSSEVFTLKHIQLAELSVEKVKRHQLELIICELELVLSQVLNQILHQANWQQLESAWRGLYLLCQTAAQSEVLIVECASASKNVLWDDLFSSSDLPSSSLYQHVYINSIGQYGAVPYGVLLVDDYFAGSGSDLTLLKAITDVCSKAHLPVVTGVSANMFDVPDFNTLQDSSYISEIHGSNRYVKWRSFISTEQASFLALTMPRLLFRDIYNKDPKGLSWFQENTGNSHEDCLWGNASFGFVDNLFKSFEDSGFCSFISGTEGGVLDLSALQTKNTNLPVEIAFSEEKEAELISLGFNPVCTKAYQNQLLFQSANSVRWGNVKVNHRHQSVDSIASAQLQYLFIVMRIIHCLKIIFRESVGATTSSSALSTILNRWLRQFVSDVEAPSKVLRAQRPLKDASVVVVETSDAGWFDIQVELSPHMKYLGNTIAINTVVPMIEEVS